MPQFLLLRAKRSLPNSDRTYTCEQGYNIDDISFFEPNMVYDAATDTIRASGTRIYMTGSDKVLLVLNSEQSIRKALKTLKPSSDTNP